MAELAAAGVPPHRFWDYTYREVFAVFAANDIRARRDRKMLAWAHHAGATFARAKRIPQLAPILRRLDPPRPMSHKAIRDTVLNAFRAMGADIVRRKKGS